MPLKKSAGCSEYLLFKYVIINGINSSLDFLQYAHFKSFSALALTLHVLEHIHAVAQFLGFDIFLFVANNEVFTKPGLIRFDHIDPVPMFLLCIYE